MAFTISNVRLNGCIFGRANKRDYRTAFRGNRTVPDRVDLRPYCTAVENQGQIGSCTANATVGALEYHYKRRDGHSPELSRMFVYYNSRRMRGQVTMDTGAEIREAMAAILAYGACSEDMWPYDANLFAMQPPPEAYMEATGHQALQYARVDSGQGAIDALAEGLPVVFGTVIPERCYEEAARTGILPAPTAEEMGSPETVAAGHSMLIVGYDNPARMFIVRNSWGEEWGDHGYCQIPYDVMLSCSRPEDFWVVAELDKARNFNLIRPGHSVAPRDTRKEYGDRDRARDGAKESGVAATAARVRDEIRASLDKDLAASSNKIDQLLSGRKPAQAVPPPRRTAGMKMVQPCTACAGSGVCAFCQGRQPGCAQCHGSGACPDCGGMGLL